MRSASPALIALLNSGAERFFMANCYTITLLNGGVYRCAELEVNVTDENGNVFLGNAVQMSGLRYSIKRGFEVDEQDLTIAAKTTDLIEGEPFLQALRSGLLDDATFVWQRSFFSSWPPMTAVGSVVLFSGYISTIDKLGRTSATVKVKSMLGRLDRPFPRNYYLPTCLWTLYGYGCGLTKSAWGHGATVAAGTTTSTIVLATSVSDLTPYQQGTISFTSGSLVGDEFTLKGISNGPPQLVSTTMPLPSAPAVGDTCMIYPGCDHTLGANGCAFFGNQSNNLSFPFVPPPGLGL